MKCSYCQDDIEKGTGLMFVKKMGTVKYYCSRRCLKFDIKFSKKQKK